jgi:hypothetical protein
MTHSQDQIQEGSSLFFEGRAWFDKSGGNTYHSVRIWVNGDIVAIVPLTYGYENAYQSSAISKLVELGYLPEILETNGIEARAEEFPLFRLEKILGITIYSVLSYGKKSELWRAEQATKLTAGKVA